MGYYRVTSRKGFAKLFDMSTLSDVAKASGASIATVSRVINGKSELVKPDMRDRVLAAMRELRYRPTPNRDRQRSAPTHNIAVILGDIEPRSLHKDTYFFGLIEGLLDTLAENGYSLTLHVQRLWKDSTEAVRHRFDGHCDGAISLAPLRTDETVRHLWSRGTPLVVIGASLELGGVGSVDMDNVGAAEEMVQYLADCGHRRIAYFGVTDRILSSQERREGCLRAGQKSPDLEIRCYKTGDRDDSDAANADRGIPLETGRTPDWVSGLVDEAFTDTWSPTAIVCWNDLMARQVLNCLDLRGLRVPRDVSVTGFDGTDPFITSFRQPLYEMGQEAVRQLLAIVGGGEISDTPVLLRAEMVVRSSVRPI